MYNLRDDDVLSRNRRHFHLLSIVAVVVVEFKSLFKEAKLHLQLYTRPHGYCPALSLDYEFIGDYEFEVEPVASQISVPLVSFFPFPSSASPLDRRRIRLLLASDATRDHRITRSDSLHTIDFDRLIN